MSPVMCTIDINSAGTLACVDGGPNDVVGVVERQTEQSAEVCRCG